MSETTSEPGRSPRPLTPAQLAAYRQELDRFAASFDDLAAALRQTPDNPLVIPELRSAMSRAGWFLTRLLHRRALNAPTRLPPWLSWRTPGNARPRFVRLLGRPFLSSWYPNGTVLGLVQVMRAGPQVMDKSTSRRPHEDSGAAFIRRHTWIEAVAGWIGQRCDPRTSVNVPTVQAVIDMGSDDSRMSTELRVHVVHDWIEDATQQRLLFLDLARDSAAACRHLAAGLGNQAPGSQPNPWPAPLSTFDALDDLRMDISHGSGAEGLEAFDVLFGGRNLHDELAALGGLRQEFKRRFAGKRDLRSIADFTVTTGYEALAFIADRLAKAAGVRRKTIPRSRDALDAARRANDPVRVERSEVDLELSGQDFAKALTRALNGWDDHRDWIRRSIEDEEMAAERSTIRVPNVGAMPQRPIVEAAPTLDVNPTTTAPALGAEKTGNVLKFARPVDAKQRCLESLEKAPNGIPGHSEIAEAIGMELQTVKEAMLKLKKAEYVEKHDGAWHITDDGRKQLKLLRGE